jgi:hypothetical protein
MQSLECKKKKNGKIEIRRSLFSIPLPQLHFVTGPFTGSQP